MEDQLLRLLEDVRLDGDEVSRRALNSLLRDQPEARAIMAEMLVNEHALISHLRHESIVSILDKRKQGSLRQQPGRPIHRSPAWQPVSAGLLAGVLLGVLGVRMVLGMPSVEAVVQRFKVVAPHFHSLDVGRLPNHFPIQFGEWCGDPAEVVEQADGSRELRFLRTANITGALNGGARSCDAFQLIDLESLREQFGDEAPPETMILKLSASFRQEHPRPDLPDLRGVCRICLFQMKPELIGKHWPDVLRDAVAVGGKAVCLGTAQEQRASASCILPPEATVAVISVSAHQGTPSGHAVNLGNVFASDIALAVIRPPAILRQRLP